MALSVLRVATSFLCLVAASSLATAKERRLWVDPPTETVVPAPGDIDPAPVKMEPDPLIHSRPDTDVRDSIGSLPDAWHQPAVDTEAVVSSSAPRSSCTTRTYKVLSGATIRVHAC